MTLCTIFSTDKKTTISVSKDGKKLTVSMPTTNFALILLMLIILRIKLSWSRKWNIMIFTKVVILFILYFWI